MSHHPATTKDSTSISLWNTGYNSYLAWNDNNWLISNVTGSAESGTAFATGKKTYSSAIGLDINKNKLKNITELAKDLGKSAGVVSSVQWSHATPASFVAHNQKRDNYSEIAKEMLLDSKMDVIMGGGHPYFDNSGNKSENPLPLLDSSKTSYPYMFIGGEDSWNMLKNAETFCKTPSINGNTTVQDIDGDNIPDTWTLIESKEDFEKLMTGNAPKRVLGTFKALSTLQQSRINPKDSKNLNLGREDAYIVPFNDDVPALKDMALGAINILSKNNNGFFLMIEGGAVDWANHDNQSGRLIEEQHDFDEAVEACVEWVNKNSNWDETLIIVTGDHETGYLTGTKDKVVFSDNLKAYHVKDRGKGKMPEMYFHHDSHTNQLIPLFAKGAGSELFHIFADEYDYHRGAFLSNSEVGQIMFLLFQK
jgi:alkaline phosphatase